MLSQWEIIDLVIRRLREAGKEIAVERGWRLDPEAVAYAENGAIRITWELPNDHFLWQFIDPDDVWFSRVPLVDTLRFRIDRIDVGGPMPRRGLVPEWWK